MAGCWIGAAGELLDGLDGQHHIVVVGVVEAKGTAASLGRQRPLAPHRTAPLEVVGAHVGAGTSHTRSPSTPSCADEARPRRRSTANAC